MNNIKKFNRVRNERSMNLQLKTKTQLYNSIQGKRRAIQRSLTACYPAIRRHFYYHFLSIATLTDFDLITLSVTSVVQAVKYIQIRKLGEFHFPTLILS